jgi:hypothetical protein
MIGSNSKMYLTRAKSGGVYEGHDFCDGFFHKLPAEMQVALPPKRFGILVGKGCSI